MAANSSPLGRRLRLLIVDDNPDAGSSLGMLLHISGHDVWVVRSGQEALDVIDEVQPDAMILDLAMPGMSGLELARRVRALPEWSDLPLMAVTGHSMDEDRQATQAVGIDHHFVKGASTGPLLQTLVSLK